MNEQNKRILIVEDETNLSESLYFLLSSEKYQVVVAPNGKAAFIAIHNAILNGKPFDLLVTDILMPEMTGEELLTLLRKHHIDMPSLVITGYGDKEMAVRMLRLGCTDFLDKPFESELIISRVREILEESDRQISEARQREYLAGIGEKTSQIAHDLNNMIGGTLGYADMALEEIEAGHPARKRLEKLMATSNQAAEICHALLDKSKRVSGSFRIKTEITTLVARMEKIFTDIAPENVSVVVSIPKEKLWLCADGDRLQQALLNIGFNALNAMPEGGVLTLSVGVENACDERASGGMRQCTVFSIGDTGKGISANVTDHLFEEGFSTRENGYGMGLACVRSIVEMEHQGWIQVASQVGKGTHFKLYIPFEVNMSETLKGNGKKTKRRRQSVPIMRR